MSSRQYEYLSELMKKCIKSEEMHQYDQYVQLMGKAFKKKPALLLKYWFKQVIQSD